MRPAKRVPNPYEDQLAKLSACTDLPAAIACGRRAIQLSFAHARSRSARIAWAIERMLHLWAIEGYAPVSQAVLLIASPPAPSA